MSPAPSGRLPDGFRVRVRDDVRRLDSGRVLVGGSPPRALRLAQPARAIIGAGSFEVDGPTSAAVAARLLAAGVADPVLPEEPVAAALLSVVLPIRDRAEQLDRALSALGSGCRVLVVDDASRDATAVAAAAARHGAEVVALGANLGPAGARNAGLRRVVTPYVAFVDCDVAVTLATLLRLARHLADPQVALVGPRIVDVSRSVRPRWFERYAASAPSLGLGPVGGVVRPGARVAWLPGACLVGRVVDLGEGFDPALRVAEDVDLVWRLVARGHTVRYAADEVAGHESRATLRAMLGRTFVYGTGAAVLAVRHGDLGAPAVLSPAMALAGTSLLLARRWSAPVAALAAARTAYTLAHSLPAAPERPRLAGTLTVRGLGWALRQECGLLLRHWWPLSVLGCLVSASARRAVVTAFLVDVVVAARAPSGVDPVLGFVGRRLHDLAYGAGLWAGALRAGSARCLVVQVPRHPLSR